jgi:hypothetical protein
MANQNENPVPDLNGKNKRKNSSLIPRFYRTDSNKKFIQATLDQLMQPGVVKKLNGYIGRQNAKSSSGKDIFISTIDSTRQNYQLEPSLVVKDELGNVDFYKDYIDYINQLSVFGAKVDNHERLNRQEFYSWNPHIDWDKFVNFQQYYWLPYGPTAIDVYGQAREVSSTYTITVEDQGNSKEYLFTPNGLTRNPVIKLYRGQTYYFDINSPGEPFSIKTAKTLGQDDRYTWGDDTLSAVESGTIKFTVPLTAPNILFYVSENDANIGNIFKIYNIKDNTEIDVESEIVGKKTYTLSNGTPLSNGMKLKFRGEVTPTTYSDDFFYVEGVGSKISLVAERDLEIISSFSSTIDVLFDDTPFDRSSFDTANSYAGKNDYIVINRASKDRNPWTRYNRWFHKDVIETSAALNNQIAELDQTTRAVRPIIEFEAGLKLFNYGLEAIVDVDLFDTVTTDAFSFVEGELSYAIDTIPLINGHRVVFAADTDILVRNKIYRVEFIEVTPPGESRRRQIRLVEESTPIAYQTALIKYGRTKQGLTYWYDGSQWILGQTKTTLNQAPLFDLLDSNYNSFSDKTVYDGTTFAGTKLFSYSIGEGTADTALGFALDYKNINNVGDILFKFNLLSDTFTYKTIYDVNTVSTDTGTLVKANGISSVSYTNGWTISKVSNYQPVVRIYRNSNKTNNFNIDVYDNINDLEDLAVRVYVNGKRVSSTLWALVDTPVYKQVVLTTPITDTDVLTIKTFAKQPKNKNGYYEIPLNLQNNPLNANINQFTLGEVIDHVDSIIDNSTVFLGDYPGKGNLRDLGDLNPYGTKFVQHSGALPLAMYHITSKDSNVIKAIQQSQNDYGKFKRQFMLAASSIDFNENIPAFVDSILENVNANKPKTSPYYFSDMAPYGAAVTTNITVVDYRTKYYPLSSNFNTGELSPSAVLIYVNDEQICYGSDYTFDGAGFVIITYSALANDDVITIVEYETTDGCFVPSTPTKLGLWPKFKPRIYKDTTLVTPRWMIEGHDGSHILAYGSYDEGGTPDYRDAAILELEKRIFNNIKFDYNPALFDLNDYLPRYVASSAYSLSEFNEILAPKFYQWSKLIDRDFTKPLSYDSLNPFTFNYRGFSAPDGRETPGYWRGIYKWLYDTDRPHLSPWEMLGLSLKPAWWEDQYGPAPYTADNLVLWQDLSEGIIREPNMPVVRDPKYLRPFLLNSIPVDADGNLRDPYESGVASGIITQSSRGDFIFGDYSPVEAAWRRSSYYPFAVISTLLLMHPSSIIGKIFDRSRIYRDASGQLVYKDTKVRTQLASVKLPNIYSDITRVQTSGLINYLVDYIQSDNLKSLSQYKYDLVNLNLQLAYRIAGFTEKEKFNLILDSKNPTAVGGVFVPQENYSIILNSSSPVRKVVYSGVIVTKLSTGYEVKGYSQTSPYFYYYPWNRAGYLINVGGISESYSEWTAGQQYAAGKLVKYSNAYYRSKVTHTATNSFDSSFYQKLPALPITGGQDAYIRNGWDKSELITVAYGTKFRTIQEVVDFLIGYGEYLKDQGIEFDNFNNNLSAITNWVTSAKEFLFWTTQNWSSGEDKWEDWLPNQDYKESEILQYNGDYYVVKFNINSGNIFDENQYNKLSELSSLGASVIALSPSAQSLVVNAPYCVVEDIKDSFNGYEFFRADGEKLEPQFINSFREDNTLEYKPKTNEGVYGASLFLIQKEHVVLIDNTTLFNDTIYEPSTGYRQEKIKISSYVSTDWYGGLDIPGFIYDQARISIWAPWTDYDLGTVVKYKEFYYSAKSFLPGVLDFDADNWIKLKEKPTSKMLPNWSYKAEQFTDFYSLDSDNFDSGQQKMAQHLIGYQKRQYLENIIQDDISEYKFYQGMIIEKGTQNVLNKLFDVLSADDKESVTFYEEWAVRMGQYGSSNAYEQIEFELNENIFKLNPQPFELTDTVDVSDVDFVIRQTANDVYLKPLGYNSSPWPTKETYIPYLRTPGYIKYDEVDISINTLSDILNEDITQFSEGSYIHCAFEGRDWNVYRLSKTNFTIVSASYNKTTKVLTLGSNTEPEISAGDIIGILHEDSIQGFHKVSSVSLTGLTINKEFPNFPDPNTVDPEVLLIFKFTVQRVNSQGGKTIDDVGTIIPSRIKTKEKLWVDDNGTGKWAVYEHNKVYSYNNVINPRPSDDLKFGQTLASDFNVTMAAVSNSKNQVLTYERAGYNDAWSQKQTLTLPAIATVVLGGFGQSIEFSPDRTWLVIGTPTASNVKTQYKGNWSNATVYVKDDVVLYNGIYYTASASVPAGNTPDVNANYWITTTVITAFSSGTASSLASQGLITVYQRNENGEYILINHIVSPLQAANELFGSKITFAGNNTMFVSALGFSSSKGKVYRFDYNTQWSMSYTSYSGAVNGDKFGYDMTSSLDGTVFAISAPNSSTSLGSVKVYSVTSTSLTLLQSLLGQDINDTEQFGTSISLTDDNEYIAVGSRYSDATEIDQGKVSIFKKSNNTYTLYQELVSRLPETSEQFGAKVGFMNNGESLVIFSVNGDTNNVFTFDDDTTTFDGNTLKIIDSRIDSGRIDVYDKYNTKWVFAESLVSEVSNSSEFGASIAIRNNHVIASATTALDQGFVSGKIYDFKKVPNTYSWTQIHIELPVVDLEKIKKVFLYNKVTNQLVTYLDIVDPLQGNFAGVADQEIKFKTFYDPAIYTLGNDAVNVDEGMAWTDKNVGMLWWDMSRAKFLDYNNGDIVYRSTTWNTLYNTASIDIYEWVESSIKPSVWDKQADTEAGLANNISGLSLYGDQVYSVKNSYDTVSKSLKPTYYFWVKNKTIVPNVPDRYISAKNVADLISDPKSQGLKYISFIGGNCFSLTNVKSDLLHSEVNLVVEYWTVDQYNINAHTEWKLISNDPTGDIPTDLEEKFIDSLCGKDKNSRVVPDFSLPPKLRYGIENRPRQSMFVNRVEALKQFIERVNSIFKVNTIVDDRDLSDLNSYEESPSTVAGIYDVVKDTEKELRFIGASTFKIATLTPIIVDGRITDVEIVDAGQGYVNAPYIDVVGDGINAKIRTRLGSSGQVIDTIIYNNGEGYREDTTILSVRSLSALVLTDSEALGRWSIYSYDTTTRVWSRTRSQNYDVRSYWNYIDWYETGYTQFTPIDFIVDATYQLPTLTTIVGQIVKVKSVGTGGWLLLEKYADSTSVDYTQSYRVIGRQYGTIQISDNLYKFLNSNLGYDGPLFDGDVYDNTASIEIRIILTAIKDKILIDNLKKDYLDAFFALVRYALHEQTFVDWVFKTSFVKAQHNVGSLKEKTTYSNDNLADFESYISEVKPYRTKIREFVSSYDKLDQTYNMISDFDLQSNYVGNQLTTVETSVVNGEIISTSDVINEYPWRNWHDNVGFKVTTITIVTGGTGYISAPEVIFESVTGSGATAKAYISQGKVNRIVLLTTGENYLTTPILRLEGGLAATGGTAATAVATIGGSVVRSNYVKVKFDRTSGQYYITKLQETETLTSMSGNQIQYNLKWSPTTDILDTNVKVNGIDLVRGTYSVTNKKSVTRGYTSYSGVLTLESAPLAGSTIEITYIKDFNFLSAADRINWYYNPGENEIGKDLPQLMTGVDYGGVQILGLGFDVSQGWGSTPWFSDAWDALDPTFDDYIITVDNTIQAGALIVGTEYKIYFLGTTDWVSAGAEASAEVVGVIRGNLLAVTGVITGTLDVDQALIGYSVIPGTKITAIEDPVSVVTTSITSTPTAITIVLSTAFPTTLVEGMTITITGAAPSAYNSTWTIDTVISDTQFTVASELDLNDATVQGTIGGISYYSVNEEHDETTIVDNIFAVERETVFTAIDPGEGTGIASPASSTFTLPYVPAVGEEINVYYKVFGTDQFFRIDEVAYAPILQEEDGRYSATEEILNILEGGESDSIMDGEVNGGTSLLDSVLTVVVLPTFIGDGITNQIVIPGTLQVNTGDTFIFRKSTSDGSVKPQEIDYDTSLSGGKDTDGFIGYQTATGLAADDILIDGDDLVSATNSPAPEECVPGQIVDAVAVKVTTRPTSGSANIDYNNYVFDGVLTTFLLKQIINSPQAVLVLFSNRLQPLIIDEDFTVNYQAREVTLVTLPPIGTVVSIISFGFSGASILDLDYFIADGIAFEFITQLPWKTDLTSLVYINGQVVNYELFETDESYDWPGSVGIRFGDAPPEFAAITYVISSSTADTFSVMKSETFEANGTSDTYQLNNAIGTSLPLDENMLVYAYLDENTSPSVYTASSSTFYTLENDQLEYFIPRNRFAPYEPNVNEFKVFVNGVELHIGVDFIIDLSKISVKIKQYIYDDNIGKDLKISINRNSSYSCDGSSITFDTPPEANTKITVISFYKHELLGIQRTNVNVLIDSTLTPDTFEYYNYHSPFGKVIKLDRAVINDKRVWLVKNGQLLQSSIDYVLNKDLQSVTLAKEPVTSDKFTVMTFGNNVVSKSFTYMQFKDMLNRVHYKRLRKSCQTVLAADLHFYDTEIIIEDDRVVSIPNPSLNLPGIIEIHGERIEYFVKTGNVLSQLRRGTLGTGVREVHAAGTIVQDIGTSETIPYKDDVLIDQMIAVSEQNTFTLDKFSPGGFTTSYQYKGTSLTTARSNTLPKDAIEAFAGGWTIKGSWSANVEYFVGDIVIYGTYKYQCLADHTSSSDIFSDFDTNWKLFVGNIRLRKDSYKIHHSYLHNESPEGDVTLPADFSVNNGNNIITLTDKLSEGTALTVIKKTGRVWQDPDSSLADSNNLISKFIKFDLELINNIVDLDGELLADEDGNPLEL